MQHSQENIMDLVFAVYYTYCINKVSFDKKWATPVHLHIIIKAVYWKRLTTGHLHVVIKVVYYRPYACYFKRC